MDKPQDIKGAVGKADPITKSALDHVQGDVLVGMLKKREAFIFFSISDQGKQNQGQVFREQLQTLLPKESDNPRFRITSAAEAKGFRETVVATKKDGLQSNSAINIAFSAKGLTALGINPNVIKDKPFNDGQFARAVALGDGKKSDDVKGKWDKGFLKKKDGGKFEDGIHGVIIVVASDDDKLNEAKDHVIGTFKTSIDTFTEIGKVREPDSQKGHEHFGFKDCITQPMIQGLDKTFADTTDNVAPIAPGIILLGRPGDPNGQPSENWAFDGSLMAFRKLEQLVPEFRADMIEMAGKPMEFDPERLGARLVGRWKSGTPVQNFGDKDSATTPEQQQAIKFKISESTNCPLAAHVRKMNPRGDAMRPVPPHRVLRRGIPYGDEVDEITEKEETKKPRGLLFVCYQSSLENGFEFLQNTWANNRKFPPEDALPDPPGVDPLIGALSDEKRAVLGGNPNPAKKQKDLGLKRPWVKSKGGEYFFSPNLDALSQAPFAPTPRV